jgi:hypothetical protein
MHEGTNILNDVAFTPDMGQVRRGALKKVHSGSWGQLRLKLRNRAIAGLMICFSDFSLWFSLPLSIWLSTGWVGLIFHWRATARMACQTEVASSSGCRFNNRKSADDAFLMRQTKQQAKSREFVTLPAAGKHAPQTISR